MTIPPSPIEEAREVAGELTKLRPELGICLVGSVARGDDRHLSDIDLLVVGTDRRLSAIDLKRQLPGGLRSPRLSIHYYPMAELERMPSIGSVFLTHVRREGEILQDERGLLAGVLAEEPEVNIDAGFTLQLLRLEPYRDLRRFRGQYLFCLQQAYSVGRAVVLLALVRNDNPEFGQSKAFVRFIERYPQLAKPATAIRRLRPFFEVARGGDRRSLPFSPTVTDNPEVRIYVEEAFGAIDEMVTHLRSEA
jgi:hypothetical protein